MTTNDVLEKSDVDYFFRTIEEIAGIHLKPSKHDLVRNRLRSRIAAHGLSSFREYRDLISVLERNDPEWEIFTNLLTTNKTDFFREPRHFGFLLEKILPEWIASGSKNFKVWSSACSTGEEAFTLAMLLDYHLPKGMDFQILATDIDTEVLRKARNSVYATSKMDEIPPPYREKNVQVGKAKAEGWFRFRKDLRSKISFEQHNLIDPAVPFKDEFDLVLCRNVLIYFAGDTIEFVQNKLYSSVRKGGYFFIGHSESLQGVQYKWQMVGPSIFRKKS